MTATGVEPGGGGDELERRAGHVETLRRPVEQRGRRVLAEPAPLVLEVGRVVGRRRRRGDERPRLGVEDDDRAPLPLELLLGDLLDPGHDGELDAGPLGLAAQQFVDPILHAEVARLAREHVVELGFDAGAPVLHGVVAHELRRDGAVGVVAVVVARAALRAGDHRPVEADDVATLDLHLLGDAALVLGTVLEPLRAHDHDPREVDDQCDEEHRRDDEHPGHGFVHRPSPSPPDAGARARSRRG